MPLLLLLVYVVLRVVIVCYIVISYVYDIVVCRVTIYIADCIVAFAGFVVVVLRPFCR